MKILKESKENLPVAFITSFVSESWEKVGILKEQIEAIKREFKGTAKVESLIQDLVDAYLICIGQLEKHLSDKDYLDIPDVSDDKEEVKESLVEELPAGVESAAATAEAKLKAIAAKGEKYVAEKEAEEKVEEDDTDKEFEAFERAVMSASLPMNEDFDKEVEEDIGPKKNTNVFDLLDFDEPDLSQPALTDDDLYGKH